MKIILSHWFSALGEPKIIGIVVGENESGERKAYIGTGIGADEWGDANHILQFGAKLHAEHIASITYHLGGHK